MSVIDFTKAKLERSPHASFEAVCLGCRHKWAGVAPYDPDVMLQLECPECHTMRGVMNYNYDNAKQRFACNCGSEAWMLHPDGPSCIGCGKSITYEELQ